MMPDCQFSTIVVAPHGPGYPDPVNVGVILYDPDAGTAYRKVTDNWEEVRRRTGYRYIPGRGEQAEQGPFQVEKGYLKNLAEGQIRDRLLVTPPRNLMPFGTHREALEWVYSMQVGVPPLGGAGPGGRAREARARLREEIAAAGFPEGSYKADYDLDLGGPSVRLPNVFLAGSEPRIALFALPLASPESYGEARRALGKVRTVREVAGLAEMEFFACVTQAESRVDKDMDHVRKSLDLLREWGVEAVYWDGIGDRLEKIRRAVLAPPTADAPE